MVLALPPVFLGGVVGHVLAKDEGLGAGLLAVSTAVFVMFLCFVGVVLSVPENSRRFMGSMPFELAALIVTGLLIGAIATALLR